MGTRVRFPLTLAVALMAGFIALSYEILWYRAFSFVSWSRPTVFGLLLGCYLFGVALGSFGSRRFCRDTESAGALRALAWFVFFSDVVGFLVIPTLARLAHATWFPAFGVVALSAGLLGAVLPLVAHFGIPADDRAGQRLSYVYLANIIGSAGGSFLTGFVLMDAWSTPVISIFLGFVGLAMVALLLMASSLASRPTKAALSAGLGAVVLAGAGAVAASPVLFDHLYERLLYKELYSPEQAFVEVVENRHGVIAVNPYQQVFGGGAYDGAFNVSLVDDKNVIERAFAVAALHPQPKQVLMIGLSSGSWAHVVSHLPGVEHLTIVEINPGYLELIGRQPQVKSLLSNPKVDIVIDDGRRWLLRHPERKFDFIVMNATYHFRAHITNLLSVEFLELARAHLLPGGVHYFNTTSSEDVQRTAATVFPHAMRVINFVAVSDSPLGFDPVRWERALREVVIDGLPALDLNEPHQRDVLSRLLALGKSLDEREYAFYALERRDALLARTAAAQIVTDDNMVCEWEDLLRFPKGSNL
ncbi:hypothetical protein [Pendulispora albinea]|uniref:Spermidine synthase n=1 Tax=Pendulispora albinea TaxID=2741071 RepID=A0ABZ2MCG4_9BACT